MRNASMFLFADDAATAARIDAIDRLHELTSIYTAEPIVEELLNRVRWPEGGRKLADPSAGDGAFLGAALTRMFAERVDWADDEIRDRLEGYEIHPPACEQARSRLRRILELHGRSPEDAATLARSLVHNRDFLTEGPAEPVFDTVIGNPPYLRWLNVPELLREEYKSHVPKFASKDMLHGFLERLNRTVRAGGEIALVTSDRWLFNSGAAQLREALGSRFGLKHLERLDCQSVFYRPKDRRRGTLPRLHPVAVHLDAAEGRSLSRDAIYPGVQPGHYEGYARLGEIAKVNLAPWLGSAGIFVLDEADAAASGIPSQHLIPAIDTDDIVDGVLQPANRFAILTTPEQEPSAEIAAHLHRNLHRMATRGRRNKWWMPPESFHKLDLESPRLLVPRIARSPRGIRVPARHLPINHNLSVVCADADTLAWIQWALSRPLAQQWVREHAAPLEGGFYSLTTTLLRQLPVEERPPGACPDPFPVTFC